jgi:hypothetical protein
LSRTTLVDKQLGSNEHNLISSIGSACHVGLSCLISPTFEWVHVEVCCKDF